MHLSYACYFYTNYFNAILVTIIDFHFGSTKKHTAHTWRHTALYFLNSPHCGVNKTVTKISMEYTRRYTETKLHTAPKLTVITFNYNFGIFDTPRLKYTRRNTNSKSYF